MSSEKRRYLSQVNCDAVLIRKVSSRRRRERRRLAVSKTNTLQMGLGRAYYSREGRCDMCPTRL